MPAERLQYNGENQGRAAERQSLSQRVPMPKSLYRWRIENRPGFRIDLL